MFCRMILAIFFLFCAFSLFAEETVVARPVVNLNEATAKELMTVSGINASRARAIIAYRRQYGSFTSLSELSRVKGFKRIKGEVLGDIQSRLSLS